MRKPRFREWALCVGAAFAAAAVAAAPATGSNPVISDTAANTAMGTIALGNNLGSTTYTGYQNTAGGFYALARNTTGYKNAAFGFEAMTQNTVGYMNAAFGSAALVNNIYGYNVTAVGADALYSLVRGWDDVAVGGYALYANTDGTENVAVGSKALQSLAVGDDNVAVGAQALKANTNGFANVAVGGGALVAAMGYENIALGTGAGSSITGGNFNIMIGNAASAADTGTIRIGDANQTAIYLSGIYGTPLTGSSVVVNSQGRLGVLVSSERFKTQIQPMPDLIGKTAQLRPVTFHLKTEPRGALQYGLIAEEVDKVFPDLVIRSSAGRIDGVRYDELSAILLLQVQKQQRELDRQALELDRQRRQLAARDAEFAETVQELVTKVRRLESNAALSTDPSGAGPITASR